MGIELGRISGPLLASNLVRKNSGLGEENLAFETNLLYLDVINGRISIHTDSPARDLTVVGTTGSTNFISTTQSTIANFVISNNQIQNPLSSITIRPNQSGTPQIVAPKLSTNNLEFSTNLIYNSTLNSDINLSPVGTGKVISNKDVFVDGKLHATGNITWDGTITFGNDNTDNVVFNADINSHVIPNIDNSYDLGSASQAWRNLYVSNIVAGTSIVTDSVSVATITANGTSYLRAAADLGTTSLNVITLTSRVNSDIIPATSSYTLGNKTGPNVWNTLYVKDLNVDGVTDITNNTVTTLTTNTNLQLQAVGTGIVSAPTSSVQINNNLLVKGNTTVNNNTTLLDTNITGTITQTGNIGQTGNSYITGLFSNNNILITGASSYLQVPDIKIQNNTISATATDSNLVFTGSGTGGVVLDNKLQFVDNTINNVWTTPTTDAQQSIYFTPNGTGNVVINSTNALTLPVGTNATRTLTIGEIRYNNSANIFEGGLTGNGLISFNGVYSTDRNTYVTADPTANIIYFNANSTLESYIDTTKLYSNTFNLGNISLSSNNITNTVANNDVILSPNGTGTTSFQDMPVTGNSIINATNSAITISSTGVGYTRFAGTNAVVIPSGATSDRRLTPEVGELRNNLELGYTEVWTGTAWVSARGNAATVTVDEVSDIMDVWTLILG